MQSGHKVTFGGQAQTKTSEVEEIRAGVVRALADARIPGAFVMDLAKLGIDGLDGQIAARVTLSRKDGRVMLNLSSVQGMPAMIAGQKLSVSGNLMLPKVPFTVDAETFKAWSRAKAEQDIARKAKRRPGVTTEGDLDEGETTE